MKIAYILLVWTGWTYTPWTFQEFSNQSACEAAVTVIKSLPARHSPHYAFCVPK